MFLPRRSKARALFSTSKAVSVPSRDIRGARRSAYCVVFSMRQVAHYTPRHFTNVHVGAGAPPAQPGEAGQVFVRQEFFVAQKKRAGVARPPGGDVRPTRFWVLPDAQGLPPVFRRDVPGMHPGDPCEQRSRDRGNTSPASQTA